MIGWFRWSWQWLDVLIQMIVAMIKRWLFQFNRRLQADPNLPHMAKLANDLILWLRRWWCFNIPYVSKNLKRETAIMAKLNHPIVVSVQEVVSVGSFYCLVLDFFPWWRRRDWEREESFELLEEISRWFFNYDHHFFDDDGNDQISMKMIVRTKKAFDLNYKRGKAMFAQEVVCAPPSSIAALSVAFNAAGFCQIQSQWWGCSITTVTMMGK